MYKGVQRCTEMYRGVQRCTEVYTDVYRRVPTCTEVTCCCDREGPASGTERERGDAKSSLREEDDDAAVCRASDDQSPERHLVAPDGRTRYTPHATCHIRIYCM